nr:CehA/McbA family metallohydrolase [Evansella tamaricis]
MRTVFVQQDEAERGYLPGVIEPGTWHVELGYAAVAPTGGWWELSITCSNPEVGEPFQAEAVDPTHIANSEPGWYHGDFHMHSYHSHPDALEYEGFVEFAREQGLDILFMTDYVSSSHWGELGPVQQANPDLLIWPGREIITYYGHANALGETWDYIEYRHGFNNVTLGDIQRETKARDVLFQVNHPTTFAGSVFNNFCRGCGFTLEDDIDWAQVDTIEVVTGPAIFHPSDHLSLGNPFVTSAIEMWEELLNQGYRITAVGGSDDKLSGRGSSPYGGYAPHGEPAVAVYATELSRAAVTRGIKDGKAYIRTLGVHESPTVELEVTGDRIETGTGKTEVAAMGTFGDTFLSNQVEATVKIANGSGQTLHLIQNGVSVQEVEITSDQFHFTWLADRGEAKEGPLGTWWRFDIENNDGRTIIANPFYLVGE